VTVVRRQSPYPPSFFVAMAATLLLFFSAQALFPTLPLYILDIGGSPADTGLASLAFALASVLFRPLAGVLADRRGRKPILVMGALAFGGGPLLYSLGSTIPLLLGARVVHGIGMALFTTTYQAFIADLLPSGRHGEGLGLANAASVVTMAAGPLFGEWMAREYGFTFLFLVLGAIGGAGVAATLALPGRRQSGRSVDPAPAPGRGGLWQVLRHQCVRAGSLGMALLGLPFGAFVIFLPLLASARELGGTGWVFAAYAVASTVVQPVAGRLADRWGAGGTAAVGLALTGLAMAGLAAVAAPPALLGLALLLGVGYGSARAGLDACVQGPIEPALRGSGAAVQYAAHDLVIGLGSWGLGALAVGAGYGPMYALVAVLTLAGLAALSRALATLKE
jgi:MFS family permease